MNSRGSALSSSSADHVIGVFARDSLSAALAATHRAGFGPQTRVFDGARSDAAQQLARAGLTLREGHAPPVDGVLVVVTAPGRTSVVTELFARLGAESTHLAARRQEPLPESRESVATMPDIRIDEIAPGVDA